MTKYVFLLLALALATSAHAQSNNCSYATSGGVAPDLIPAANDPCGGTYRGSVLPNYGTFTTNDHCIDTNINQSYASHDASVTGYGQTNCPLLFGLAYPCVPQWDQQFVDAQYSWQYNQAYLRAYDVNYVSVNTCVRNGTFRQDFWQCQGVECSTYTCTICPKLPTSCCTCPCGSPIVLDISGQGYNLTSAAQGVMFDLKGDGKLWQMAWTAKGSSNAFLALPGPDGLVHGGQQLFGNFTPQPPCPVGDKSCFTNGFRALAVYDDPKNGGNGDGIIDARDAIFSSLRLWVDANHDGISQPEELHTLPSLGINSISLSYKMSEKTDQYGNVFEYRAQLNPDNQTDAGKTAYDIFFVVQGPTTTGQSCPVPAVGKQPTPAIVKR